MNWAKRNVSKFIDSIAYVVWSLAIWMLTYYQLLDDINSFDKIRYGYGMSIWLWLIAAIILYGNSAHELRHEILKSSLILVGSSILDLVYNHNGTIDLMIKKFVCLLMYQCIGFILIYFFSSSQKLHGRFAKVLAFWYMGIFGTLYLILKINLFIALIVSSIIGLLLGWRYHKYFRTELKQKQIEQERKQNKETKKENEIIEMKRKLEFLEQENIALKEENKQLQKNITMLNTKNKRKMKRVSKHKS